jgi:hypothetical protein
MDERAQSRLGRVAPGQIEVKPDAEAGRAAAGAPGPSQATLPGSFAFIFSIRA